VAAAWEGQGIALALGSCPRPGRVRGSTAGRRPVPEGREALLRRGGPGRILQAAARPRTGDVQSVLMNIDRGVGAHARSKLANIRGQNSRTKPLIFRCWELQVLGDFLHRQATLVAWLAKRRAEFALTPAHRARVQPSERRQPKGWDGGYGSIDQIYTGEATMCDKFVSVHCVAGVGLRTRAFLPARTEVLLGVPAVQRASCVLFTAKGRRRT
jgi:hypothetical protein